jgi:hypothetical protein
LAEKPSPRLLPPPPERRTRRPGVPLAVSVALHVLIGAGLLELLLMPRPHSHWLKQFRGATPPIERIGFLQLPEAGKETNVGKSGGNGQPITKARPPKVLTAPAAVPTGIPAAPAQPVAPPAGAGTGPVVGTGGATQGVRPEFTDPRFAAPGAGVTAPKSATQQIDSMLSDRIKVHNDSAAALGEREPGDWTFKSKDGQEWGVDQKYIRLGPVSIPDAVLAVLPINHLGENPEMGQRERQLNAMRSDIMQGAQRQLNEDDFRRAVKDVRERKEKEHEELLKLQQQAKPKPPPPPPTIANDGGTYSTPPAQPEVQ